MCIRDRFTDANKTLETDLPEGHPQEAVARLVYTYNERRVGDAWIYSSSAQAVNATPSEPVSYTHLGLHCQVRHLPHRGSTVSGGKTFQKGADLRCHTG